MHLLADQATESAGTGKAEADDEHGPGQDEVSGEGHDAVHAAQSIPLRSLPILTLAGTDVAVPYPSRQPTSQRDQAMPPSGNQIANSAAALSGESDACTRFRLMLLA